MGDAADDAFDDELLRENDRLAALSVCEEPEPRECRFEMNDDGLFECRACGKVVDL